MFISAECSASQQQREMSLEERRLLRELHAKKQAAESIFRALERAEVAATAAATASGMPCMYVLYLSLLLCCVGDAKSLLCCLAVPSTIKLLRGFSRTPCRDASHKVVVGWIGVKMHVVQACTAFLSVCSTGALGFRSGKLLLNSYGVHRPKNSQQSKWWVPASLVAGYCQSGMPHYVQALHVSLNCVFHEV